jgi:hypothetical protein
MANYKTIETPTGLITDSIDIGNRKFSITLNDDYIYNIVDSKIDAIYNKLESKEKRHKADKWKSAIKIRRKYM